MTWWKSPAVASGFAERRNTSSATWGRGGRSPRFAMRSWGVMGMVGSSPLRGCSDHRSGTGAVVVRSRSVLHDDHGQGEIPIMCHTAIEEPYTACRQQFRQVIHFPHTPIHEPYFLQGPPFQACAQGLAKG